MFGFLNSTILLAAAAALIPLLIHLFSRRRVKVVEFSSLKHLKEMQKRQLRRLKIRQWLLLILRMLIVLMAVLAFARPTAREGAVGSHAAVSAVLLFDNSPSMDRVVADGNLLEIARQRAGQLLETFAPADRVVIFELDRPAAVEGREWVSSAVASEQLDRMQRGGSRAKLQNGLQTAVQLLDGAADYNKEVYYIGDRQRASLPEESIAELGQFPLYLVDLPLEDYDNLGLVSVDFGGQLIHAGHDFNLVATIRNYGGEGSGERIASLFIDGKRVAQTDFVAPSGGETTVRFERSVASTGFHSGYVELSDDRLAADNRYFFSFRIPEQFNLLVVDADPVAPFVSLALTPPGSGSQYWSVKTATPADLSGINFNDYQVVMLAGMPELPEEHVRRLDSFVRRGGALLMTYGVGTNIDYFNKVWSRLSGVSYQQAVPLSFSRAGYYGLEQFDNEHPIFQPFGFDTDGPPDVKFYALPQHTVVDGVRTLLRFSGGRPALVEAVYGGGRVLTFCGPMSPGHTDLTSHGFFVPFISRTMEYLAADLTSLDTKLYAGQSITRSLPSVETGVYAVDLVNPDSSIVRLSPEDSDGLLIIRSPVLDREGVYSIRRQGREIDRFAINLDPSESDLTPVDPDQLATAAGATTHRLLGFDKPLAEAISGYRVGKELWQILLWVAAVLLAVEMLLGRRASEE